MLSTNAVRGTCGAASSRFSLSARGRSLGHFDCAGALHVAFWGAAAMGCTAAVGRLAGTFL
jgi:hypothetical protein